MTTLATAMASRVPAGQRGFSLLGVLLSLLAVGILTAIAVSIYLGSVRSALGPDSGPGGTGGPIARAKAVEAAGVAGSLWSALQASAFRSCGTPIAVSSGYAMAGLSSAGSTTPPRWSVPSSSATLRADCSTGALAASSSVLFTVEGVAPDVAPVRVQFIYDPGQAPPSRLRCSTDAGATFVDC